MHIFLKDYHFRFIIMVRRWVRLKMFIGTAKRFVVTLLFILSITKKSSKNS